MPVFYVPKLITSRVGGDGGGGSGCGVNAMSYNDLIFMIDGGCMTFENTQRDCGLDAMASGIDVFTYQGACQVYMDSILCDLMTPVTIPAEWDSETPGSGIVDGVVEFGPEAMVTVEPYVMPVTAEGCASLRTGYKGYDPEFASTSKIFDPVFENTSTEGMRLTVQLVTFTNEERPGPDGTLLSGEVVIENQDILPGESYNPGISFGGNQMLLVQSQSREPEKTAAGTVTVTKNASYCPMPTLPNYSNGTEAAVGSNTEYYGTLTAQGAKEIWVQDCNVSKTMFIGAYPNRSKIENVTVTLRNTSNRDVIVSVVRYELVSQPSGIGSPVYRELSDGNNFLRLVNTETIAGGAFIDLPGILRQDQALYVEAINATPGNTFHLELETTPVIQTTGACPIPLIDQDGRDHLHYWWSADASVVQVETYTHALIGCDDHTVRMHWRETASHTGSGAAYSATITNTGAFPIIVDMIRTEYGGAGGNSVVGMRTDLQNVIIESGQSEVVNMIDDTNYGRTSHAIRSRMVNAEDVGEVTIVMPQ